MLRGMRLTTSAIAFASSITLAGCPGGGDDTGTASGASTTTGTAGSTSGATTSPTTGASEGTTSGASGTGTTTGQTSGPQTTGSTSEGTTAPGTTTTEGTSTEGTSTTTEGSTGAGSTTGGGGGGACQTDADCKLHDDCCSCYGIPKDQPDDPICKALCDVSKCAQAKIDNAVCRFGQCTTEKVKCSGEVACDSLPPDCPEGELPGKTDACWTGGCVPAASCDAVEDCAQCPDNAMCVEYQAFVFKRVCEPIPAACDGAPTCACAGDLACEDPFNICNEGEKETDLVCVCPTC